MVVEGWSEKEEFGIATTISAAELFIIGDL